MRAVIQAVSSASVRVNGGDPRAIGPGLVILFGVKDTDTLDMVPRFAEKCAGLRIFHDADGKLNPQRQGTTAIRPWWCLSSPCTGDTKKGMRPSFIRAAKPPAVGAGLRAVCGRDGKAGPERGQARGVWGGYAGGPCERGPPGTIVMDTDEWKKGD